MIAHNCAISYLRHCQVIKFESVDEEGIYEIQDDKKGPENEAIDQDVQQILMSLIDELPTEQKIVLFMFYYENMSVKEIADICGCPEKTIYSRLSYARKNLRDKVEKLEDKGVKLRCIVALPFIYAVFKYETGKVYASVEVPECTNIIANTGKISAQNIHDVISVGGKFMKSKILGIILAAIVGIGVVSAGIIAIVSTKSDDKTVEVTTVAESPKGTEATEGNSTETKDEYIEGTFPSKIFYEYNDDNTIYRALVVIENTSDVNVTFEVTNDFNELSEFNCAKAGSSTVVELLFSTINGPTEFNYFIKAEEANANLDLAGNDDIKVSSYALGNKIFFTQEVVGDFDLCYIGGTTNYVVIFDKDDNVIGIESLNLTHNIKNGDILYSLKITDGEFDHYEIFPSCEVVSAPLEEIGNTNVELIFTTDNGSGIESYTNITNNNDFTVDVAYLILAYNSDDLIVGENFNVCYGIMPSETVVDCDTLLIAEDQEVVRYEISRPWASRSSEGEIYSEEQFVITEKEIDTNTFIVDVINNTNNEKDIRAEICAKIYDANGNIINMFNEVEYFEPGETEKETIIYSKFDEIIKVDQIDHIEYFVHAR